MNNRREPPSLGTWPPAPSESDPRRELDDGMPRIVTSRTQPPPGALRHDGPITGPPPGQRRTPRRPPPPPEAEHEGWSGLRLLFYVLLGLTAFVAAAAVAAVALVPTDLIRDRLQTEVKARTGRDLVIAGRSSLSLWPRPTVVVRDVTLSGPPQMGSAPLFKAGEIEVAVQMLPLLLHDVAIDQLLLRRASIDLHIDAGGRRNWDFAAADTPVRYAQVTAPSAKDLPKELQDFMRGSTANGGSQRSVRFNDLTLGNVGIADSAIHYRDDRSGVDERFTAISAQFSLPNMARPLDTTADFTWHGEPMHMTAQLSPVRALLEGRPVQAQIVTGAAPLALTYEGSITPGDTLDFDGHVTATATSLDRLARWTGRPLAGSLPGGLTIDARLKQTSAGTALNDARLTVGPFEGNGSLTVETRGARPYVKGAIHLATLDLTLLRTLAEGPAHTQMQVPAVAPPAPPAEPSAGPKSIEDLLSSDATASPSPPQRQVRGSVRREGWSDDAIDLAPLGLADADIKLGFDRVVWQDLTTGSGQIGLSVKSKVARISLDDVQLYEGRARGIVTIDGSGAEALVGGNLVADGVSALPFLTAMGGFDWLSGRAHTAIAVAGRGTTERQIVSTLTGKADISIADGALMGLNFTNILRNLGQGKLVGYDRSPNEKTDFSAFAASAQIANGIVRNTDLRITSADLSATGAGTIDLPQRTMDYTMRPKLTSVGGLEIPLKITGSIDKPTVTPELAGLLRDPKQLSGAIDAVAKTPIGRDIGDTVKGLMNGDPAAKAKARGFLDQLLKQ